MRKVRPGSESAFAGGTTVTVAPSASRILAPGSYGAVTVGSNAKLQLTPGIYRLASLQVEPGGELILDSAAVAAPTVLFVEQGVNFKGKVVGVQAAARFLLGSLGTGTAYVEKPFRGAIWSPRGGLRLAPVGTAGHEGSFFARTLEVEASMPVRFVPFGFWNQVFAPTLEVGCVSRARTNHSAAVFSVYNQHGVPVTVPRGPLNFLTASTLRSAPLEVFPPGDQDRMYWVRFGGDQLLWTLLGKE